MESTRAVFCDRDGVIINDLGYLSDPAQVDIIEGVPQAISLLKEHGFRVVVITNQSGVARGLFPERAVHDVNEHVNLLLSSKGATIDSFYYCPHHAEAAIEQYRVACECRKPKPGMLVRAAGDLAIDLTKSFMVGDKPSDVIAGQSAGTRSVLIGSSDRQVALEGCRPDWVAPDLLGAARWILAQE